VVHADEAGWGKVNQSMSFGLPCVATQIAAEGMEAIHGRERLVADDPQAEIAVREQ
jgi:hypothetical protein